MKGRPRFTHTGAYLLPRAGAALLDCGEQRVVPLVRDEVRCGHSPLDVAGPDPARATGVERVEKRPQLALLSADHRDERLLVKRDRLRLVHHCHRDRAGHGVVLGRVLPQVEPALAALHGAEDIGDGLRDEQAGQPGVGHGVCHVRDVHLAVRVPRELPVQPLEPRAVVGGLVLGEAAEYDRVPVLARALGARDQAEV